MTTLQCQPDNPEGVTSYLNTRPGVGCREEKAPKFRYKPLLLSMGFLTPYTLFIKSQSHHREKDFSHTPHPTPYTQSPF